MFSSTAVATARGPIGKAQPQAARDLELAAARERKRLERQVSDARHSFQSLAFHAQFIDGAEIVNNPELVEMAKQLASDPAVRRLAQFVVGFKVEAE